MSLILVTRGEHVARRIDLPNLIRRVTQTLARTKRTRIILTYLFRYRHTYVLVGRNAILLLFVFFIVRSNKNIFLLFLYFQMLVVFYYSLQLQCSDMNCVVTNIST